MSQEEGVYAVEAVIGMRRSRGKTEYLIKWEGFAESEATWEAGAHLQQVKPLIDEYKKRTASAEKSPKEQAEGGGVIKSSISYDTPTFANSGHDNPEQRHISVKSSSKGSSNIETEKESPKDANQAGNESKGVTLTASFITKCTSTQKKTRTRLTAITQEEEQEVEVKTSRPRKRRKNEPKKGKEEEPKPVILKPKKRDSISPIRRRQSALNASLNGSLNHSLIEDLNERSQSEIITERPQATPPKILSRCLQNLAQAEFDNRPVSTAESFHKLYLLGVERDEVVYAVQLERDRPEMLRMRGLDLLREHPTELLNCLERHIKDSFRGKE